jgi:hypothetical protein
MHDLTSYRANTDFQVRVILPVLLSFTAEISLSDMPFSTLYHRVPSQKATSYRIPNILLALLEQIKETQEAAVNITSQKKDAAWLRNFLAFCEGLGISACSALPASEDILLAWAASYAGHIAGKNY